MEVAEALVADIVDTEVEQFYTCAIAHTEVARNAPCVVYVCSELVLEALVVLARTVEVGILNAVINELARIGRHFMIILCGAACIVDVAVQLVDTESPVVAGGLLLQFGNEHSVLHAESVNLRESALDGAVERIAVVGIRSVGILVESHCELVATVSIRVRELALHSQREVVAQIVVEKGCCLVCACLDNVVEVVGYKFAGLHVAVLHHAVYGQIRVAAHAEVLKLRHLAVAVVCERSVVGKRCKRMGLVILVEHAEASAVVVEEMCESGCVELCTVDIVGELQVHAARVEVLVGAKCEVGLLGEFAREVEVEVLCAESVGLILQLALELLAATLHIRVDTIANLAELDGCRSDVLQALTCQQLLAAPVVAGGIRPIIVYGRQAVYRYCGVAHRQTYLYLTRLGSILCVEHYAVVVACGFGGVLQCNDRLIQSVGICRQCRENRSHCQKRW